MREYRKSKTPPEFRNQMQTPQPIVDWLTRQYKCDVDLAARPSNKKFHYYFSDIPPASNVEADGHCGNALTDQWAWEPGHVGFCNPPYDNLIPWLNKASHEAMYNHFTSVFLIPTFNGEKWGSTAFRATEIILIEKRISFIQPWDGKPNDGNNRGSMIAVFSPSSSPVPSFNYLKQDVLK